MKTQYQLYFKCSENWSSMSETQQGRFCKSCSKEVIDLSKSKASVINKRLGGKQRKETCANFYNYQIDKNGKVLSEMMSTTKKYFLAVVSIMFLLTGCNTSKHCTKQVSGKVKAKPYRLENTIKKSDID